MKSDATENSSNGQQGNRPQNKPTRIRRWLVFALLLLSLGPYLYSRFQAPQHRIQQFDSGIDVETERVASDDLSIVSFNIAHGRGTADSNWAELGGPKRKRIAAIAEKLKEIDADIVVLNEVDFNSTWSGGQNQAAAIAKTAGYRYHVEQRNLDFGFIYGTWQLGNAILSRHPIVGTQEIDLPPKKNWEDWLVGCKRGVVASIQLTPDKTIRVAAVHLEHRSEVVRSAGAALLLELNNDKEAGRLILAGDFNSTPFGFPKSKQPNKTRNALDLIFESKAVHCYPESNPQTSDYTFSTMQPKSVIDWIMVARQTDQETTSPFSQYNVVDTTLSDHRLLHAVIKLD